MTLQNGTHGTDGQTDGQTDRQTEYDAIYGPLLKEEGRIKSAQRDANTARAGCSKVRTPPARYTPTDRTNYNTLRRS